MSKSKKKTALIKKIIREELGSEQGKKFLVEFYGQPRGGGMTLPPAPRNRALSGERLRTGSPKERAPAPGQRDDELSPWEDTIRTGFVGGAPASDGLADLFDMDPAEEDTTQPTNIDTPPGGWVAPEESIEPIIPDIPPKKPRTGFAATDRDWKAPPADTNLPSEADLDATRKALEAEPSPLGEDPLEQSLPQSFVYEQDTTVDGRDVGDQITDHLANYGIDEHTQAWADSPWSEDSHKSMLDPNEAPSTKIYVSQGNTIEGELQDDGSYTRKTSRLTFDSLGRGDYVAMLMRDNNPLLKEHLPEGLDLNSVELSVSGPGSYGLQIIPAGPIQEPGGMVTTLESLGVQTNPDNIGGPYQQEYIDQLWEKYESPRNQALLKLYDMDSETAVNEFGLSEDPLQRVLDAQAEEFQNSLINDETLFHNPIHRQRYVNMAQGEAAAAKAQSEYELWNSGPTGRVKANSALVYKNGKLATGKDGKLTPHAASLVRMAAGVGSNIHSRSPGRLTTSGQWERSVSEQNAKAYARMAANGTAWSAMFISSVMDDPMFEGGEGHHTYMGHARVRRALGLRAGEYGAFKPEELDKFRVGDIVCGSRNGLTVGDRDVFDDVRSGTGNHCDIVTGFTENERGESEVVLIGGNVSNSVSRRSWKNRLSGARGGKTPDPKSPGYEGFMVIRKADQDYEPLSIPGAPDIKSTKQRGGTRRGVMHAKKMLNGTVHDRGIEFKRRQLSQEEIRYLFYLAHQGASRRYLNDAAAQMQRGHKVYDSKGNRYLDPTYNAWHGDDTSWSFPRYGRKPGEPLKESKRRKRTLKIKINRKR